MVWRGEAREGSGQEQRGTLSRRAQMELPPPVTSGCSEQLCSAQEGPGDHTGPEQGHDGQA